MFMRRQTDTRDHHIIYNALKTAAFALLAFALPSMALAQQVPSNIDMITTASIPSQAMLWTVDPSIILMLLAVAFVALSVAGFALARRSLRDAVQQQQRERRRSFK